MFKSVMLKTSQLSQKAEDVLTCCFFSFSGLEALQINTSLVLKPNGEF